MLRIRRGISFILIAAFISGLLSGCGKTKKSSSDYIEKSDEDAEVSTKTSQEHDFWKLNSKAEDHRLTLMFQHLEAPGTAGKYYNRIAVTGGDNEPVKNIINNSMQDLENQAARSDGYSYASVLRNDDILLSYQCGYVEDNYKHTNYNKTINVADGSELELSDIIVDMEMLPKAMYAEAYQVIDDDDDFIDYINYLIEEDMLYWSVNEYGISLTTDTVYTAAVLAAGKTHPVTAYGFIIFLSRNEYPQLFNSSYFDGTDSEMSMSYIPDSKISLNDNDCEIIKENETNGVEYSYYNTLYYAQDLNLILYTDGDWGAFNQLCIYDLDNKTGYTEKIGDNVGLILSGIPYLAELKGNKFLLYSMVHSKYDQNKGDYIYTTETFVFRIEDHKITMTDRVNGLINFGGGEMSPDGFYMNFYEDMTGHGLDEKDWNSLPMYMLTRQGKIVQKK